MNIKEHKLKENKLDEQLKDPKESHSKEIAKLIDKTIKGKHMVYLSTDWHLWTRLEKGKRACKRRNGFEEIIKNANEAMTKDDLLIYMGDLVDGEFDDKDELKSILKTIPGNKILVIGNNDIFDVSFYKSCGFEYVVRSFVWHDILFTHIPVVNDNQLNIHGHLHNFRTYWVPYKNHIDVASCGGREKPVELWMVIKSQKSYSRTIKESPEHFNESYDLFYTIMRTNYFIPDPYEAE